MYSQLLYLFQAQHAQGNRFLDLVIFAALGSAPHHNSFFAGKLKMTSVHAQSENEESSFVEFRRKVRSAEVLSPIMERLLWSLHFTGRVSVVIQNGRVLKSGYEEGYFRQRPQDET